MSSSPAAAHVLDPGPSDAAALDDSTVRRATPSPPEPALFSPTRPTASPTDTKPPILPSFSFFHGGSSSPLPTPTFSTTRTGRGVLPEGRFPDTRTFGAKAPTGGHSPRNAPAPLSGNKSEYGRSRRGTRSGEEDPPQSPNSYEGYGTVSPATPYHPFTFSEYESARSPASYAASPSSASSLTNSEGKSFHLQPVPGLAALRSSPSSEVLRPNFSASGTSEPASLHRQSSFSRPKPARKSGKSPYKGADSQHRSPLVDGVHAAGGSSASPEYSPGGEASPDRDEGSSPPSSRRPDVSSAPIRRRSSISKQAQRSAFGGITPAAGASSTSTLGSVERGGVEAAGVAKRPQPLTAAPTKYDKGRGRRPSGTALTSEGWEGARGSSGFDGVVSRKPWDSNRDGGGGGETVSSAPPGKDAYSAPYSTGTAGTDRSSIVSQLQPESPLTSFTRTPGSRPLPPDLARLAQDMEEMRAELMGWDDGRWDPAGDVNEVSATATSAETDWVEAEDEAGLEGQVLEVGNSREEEAKRLPPRGFLTKTRISALGGRRAGADDEDAQGFDRPPPSALPTGSFNLSFPTAAPPRSQRAMVLPKTTFASRFDQHSPPSPITQLPAAYLEEPEPRYPGAPSPPLSSAQDARSCAAPTEDDGGDDSDPERNTITIFGSPSSSFAKTAPPGASFTNISSVRTPTLRPPPTAGFAAARNRLASSASASKHTAGSAGFLIADDNPKSTLLSLGAGGSPTEAGERTRTTATAIDASELFARLTSSSPALRSSPPISISAHTTLFSSSAFPPSSIDARLTLLCAASSDQQRGRDRGTARPRSPPQSNGHVLSEGRGDANPVPGADRGRGPSTATTTSRAQRGHSPETNVVKSAGPSAASDTSTATSGAGRDLNLVRGPDGDHPQFSAHGSRRPELRDMGDDGSKEFSREHTGLLGEIVGSGGASSAPVHRPLAGSHKTSHSPFSSLESTTTSHTTDTADSTDSKASGSLDAVSYITSPSSPEAVSASVSPTSFHSTVTLPVSCLPGFSATSPVPPLILDARSLNSYLSANPGRLRGSINVNLPSLLVKRFQKAPVGTFDLASFISTDMGKRRFAEVVREVRAAAGVGRAKRKKWDDGGRSSEDSSEGGSGTAGGELDGYWRADIVVLFDDATLETPKEGDSNKAARPRANASANAGKVLLSVLERIGPSDDGYDDGDDRNGGGVYFVKGGIDAARKEPGAERWFVQGEREDELHVRGGPESPQPRSAPVSPTHVPETISLSSPGGGEIQLHAPTPSRAGPAANARKLRGSRSLNLSVKPVPYSGAAGTIIDNNGALTAVPTRQDGSFVVPSPPPPMPLNNTLSVGGQAFSTRASAGHLSGDAGPTLRSPSPSIIPPRRANSTSPRPSLARIDTSDKVLTMGLNVPSAVPRRLQIGESSRPGGLKVPTRSATIDGAAFHSHMDDLAPPTPTLRRSFADGSGQDGEIMDESGNRAGFTSRRGSTTGCNGSQQSPISEHEHESNYITFSSDHLAPPTAGFSRGPRNFASQQDLGDRFAMGAVPGHGFRNRSEPGTPTPVVPGGTHPEADFTVSTILPGFLYLGPDIQRKEDVERLRSLGVKRILNMAYEIEDGGAGLKLKEHFERYLKIPMKDNVEATGVQKGVREALRFLDDARLHSSPTYVHCKAGKSRSVTVVLAFLIHANHWSLKRAYSYVVERRKGVSPNIGFVAELMKFEEVELGLKKSTGIIGGPAGMDEEEDESEGGQGPAGADAMKTLRGRGPHVRDSLPSVLTAPVGGLLGLDFEPDTSSPVSPGGLARDGDRSAPPGGSSEGGGVSGVALGSNAVGSRGADPSAAKLGDHTSETEVKGYDGRYRSRRPPVDEVNLAPARRATLAGLESGIPFKTLLSLAAEDAEKGKVVEETRDGKESEFSDAPVADGPSQVSFQSPDPAPQRPSFVARDTVP